MKNILAYFLKYPIAVNTVMAVIIIFGVVSYSQLTASFFPLIDSRIITIQVVYPGASPSEMEEGVVALVEEKIEGLTGIERTTSVSNENFALVTIEVLKGYDTDVVLEDIKNAVNSINSFPSGSEKPIVSLRENINFTISYAISADSIDLHTLKAYARVVERDLLNAEGISKVELKGFPKEEIEISFDDIQLRRYGISIDQAANLIRTSNLDITGGNIKTSDEELLIRSRNKGYYAKDLENLVLLTQANGSVLRLKEIATIKDKWSDDPNRIFINGKPGVEVLVSSTDKEDLLKNADYVRKYFKLFQERNPGLTATMIKDQSETLNERRDLLIENGIIGMVLVLILLSLFLNVRIAAWVALGIPLSFLGMFVLANYYGVTINVISLFGMIVVIGILVDDAIVVSENVFSHYEQGKSALRAALDGTMEVLPAVISAVLTTMMAFGFFFMVDGRAGDFFSELSFVVIATLFVSLIEALIILPSHLAHSKGLKSGKKKNLLERKTDTLMAFMRDKLYAVALKFALKHRFFALMIPIALFMITVGGIKGGLIKFTFFPFIERNEIPIDLTLASGTREHITNENLIAVEKAIEEVRAEILKKDGTDIIKNLEREVGPKTNEGKVTAILVSSEERNVNSVEIAAMIREKIGLLPAIEKMTVGSTSAFGKPVSATLLSQNQQTLDGAVEDMKTEMKRLDELKDVVENVQLGQREINIKLKEKAYILGLTEGMILSQIRSGYFGFEAQRLQRGKDEVKVWVRFNDAQKASIFNLEDTRIKTLDGKEVPLRELADFEIERGVSGINHLNGKKQITVDAELSNNLVSAPQIISKIKNEIVPKIMSHYSDLSVIFEGQNREAEKTQKSSKTALPIVLLSILIIITFTFRSVAQGFLILFILVPFSFFGVAWGHYIHGQQLSILSFLGVVALIGIIVNDSLVLVSKMNSFLKEGMSFKDAVFQAGYVRFRAIFLTSATTIAGLAPLILERSFQAQFLVPMAISVAYGIAVATLLTLILLPVILSLWNDLQRGVLFVWNAGEMPSAEEIEPAVKELKMEHDEEI